MIVNYCNSNFKYDDISLRSPGVLEVIYNLKGPPENGGKPRPKTAPMSPSRGVARMPSWWLEIASFTNLRWKSVFVKRDSRIGIWAGFLDLLVQGNPNAI